MNFKKLKAAYQEGYAHGLREMGSRFKHYEDMEEAKHYFEGYKCGLEECYGLQPNRGLVDETQSAQDVVDNMASFGAEEGALGEMDKGDWMKHKAQTTPGDTFKAFGQTFNDKEVLETEYAFEALEKQLNALIKEDVEQKPVVEGISVSMSTGQEGSPDSVSVTATDAESAKLLDFIKQVGLGGLGSAEASVASAAEPAVAVVSDYGGPKFAGHDMPDMSSILSKLSNLSSEEHGHDHGSTCNECGMMEEKCGCEKEEVVDEQDQKYPEGMTTDQAKAHPGYKTDPKFKAEVDKASEFEKAFTPKPKEPPKDAKTSEKKVDETQTVDQSEEMVAEDDGEGTLQAGAQEAEINASMPARGGAVTESIEVIEQKEEDVAVDAAGPVDYEPEADMKGMLGKLDNISNKSDNSYSNTSSYEVNGKPATQDEYNKAMSNFKMPDMPNFKMPDMPNMDNSPYTVQHRDNSAMQMLKNIIAGLDGKFGAALGALGNVGAKTSGEKMYDLPGGSKVNQADFDQFILPPVEVTGIRKGDKSQSKPGDVELGHLLNLSGANTYDELLNWLKTRDGYKLASSSDELQPVKVTGRRVPAGDDELQPVKVTGKRVPPEVTMGDKRELLPQSDSDLESMQAQLDAMLKDMPGMDDEIKLDEISYRTVNKVADIAKDRREWFIQQADELRAKLFPRPGNIPGPNRPQLSPDEYRNLKDKYGQSRAAVTHYDKLASKAGTHKDKMADIAQRKADDLANAQRQQANDLKFQKDMPARLRNQSQETQKIDEWANDAGQKGTDAAFERDIEFMTKVIAGGLNKPKATGQTTIPVIAGQDARTGHEDIASWKKLAGLEK